MLKQMKIKTWREVILAKAGSVMNYGALLITGETESVISDYHTGMMRLFRAINGEFVFKEPCEQTCLKAGVKLPRQILTDTAIKYAHRVMFTHEPKPIFNSIYVPKHPRTCQEIFSSLNANTNRRKQNIILRLPKLYNKIPDKLKLLNPKAFNEKLRKYNISYVPIT